jgi:hypothetical protein
MVGSFARVGVALTMKVGDKLPRAITEGCGCDARMKKAAYPSARANANTRWEPGWKRDATDAEGNREAG